jgi:hypothetical protein
MARKNRYPKRQILQLPIMMNGGTFGNVSPMGATLNSGAFKTAGVTKTPTNGMSIASGVGSAAGSIFSGLAQNAGGTQVPDSATQQTVDSLLSNIPFYSVGNAIGDWAATDYKNVGADTSNLETYGKLADPGKYDVASTISGFLGPDNLISGLSGDGWTAGERRSKIEDKMAPQRNALIAQKAAQYKQREIDAGLGGNYQDINNMMMAREGGPLPVNGFDFQGSMQDFEMGGQFPRTMQNTNYFRWSSNPDTYAMGGAMSPNGPQTSNVSMDKSPQNPVINEYGVGGTHAENSNGGIPVDSNGTPSVVSGQNPIALTEENEVSWWNPSTKTTYVFSNSLFRE